MMLCPTLVTRQKHLSLISVFFVFKSYIYDIHYFNSFFFQSWDCYCNSISFSQRVSECCEAGEFTHTHIIVKMITTIIIIDMVELITQSLSCVRLMMYSVCAQLKGTAQGAWYHLKCSGQGVGIGINRKTCAQTDTDLQTKVFKDILSVYRDNENKSDVNQLFPPDK